MHRSLSVLFSIVTLIATGCGGEKLHPVEGTVTFADGSPMTGGSVEFRSEEADTKGQNATGTIDATGKFTLQTYRGNKYQPRCLSRQACGDCDPAARRGFQSRIDATTSYPCRYGELRQVGTEVRSEARPKQLPADRPQTVKPGMS